MRFTKAVTEAADTVTAVGSQTTEALEEAKFAMMAIAAVALLALAFATAALIVVSGRNA
jgi:hypothetical protein